MSHPSTPPADNTSHDRPRRVSRTLLTLALAGGLAAGGVGIAYADSNIPAANSTTGASSAGTAGSSSGGGTATPPAPPTPGADGVRPNGGPGGHAASGRAGDRAAGGRAGDRSADGTTGASGRGPAEDRPGPGKGRHADAAADIDGRITAVNASTLTVADEFCQARSYTVGSTTRMHQGPQQTLTASDLTVGEHVHVRGQAASTSGATLQAVDVDVHLAHIDGVVTAVSSTGLMVTDRDGFTRAITTDSTTRYGTAPNRGASGSPAAGSVSADSVKVGTVISAMGRVDSDGITLDATAVEIRTAPAAGGGNEAGAPVRPTSPTGTGPDRGTPQPAGPSGGSSEDPSTGSSPDATPSAGATPSVDGS